MRSFATVAVLLLVSAGLYAQGPRPCEELKNEIAQKLEAKDVKSYTLEVVAKDKEEDGKVVGTCEGGTKKIVYRKGATAPQTPAPEAKKPQSR